MESESPAAGVSWRWRVARTLLLTLAVALILFPGCLMWFEEQLIFFPSRYPYGRWDLSRLPQPARGNRARIEEVWLTAEDGVRLFAWFATPENGEGPVPAEKVLLWFHGNAGNLSDRYEMLVGMLNLPARVLLTDYRGYGRSEGTPDEEGVYRDARAAWKYLTQERGLPPSQIVIFGKSLGGGPAVQLATEVTPAGLIVQSSFTSIPDMAAHVFPWVPQFLIHTKMNSKKKIATIRVPKLIIHSPEDEVVPYELGRRLFEAAAEPKRFYEVPHGGHNEIFIAGGEGYWNALRDFLKELP